MRFVSLAQCSCCSSIFLVTALAWLAESQLGSRTTAALAQDTPPSLTARPSANTVRPEVIPRDCAELEIALGRIRMVPDRFKIVRKHEQFDWPTAGVANAPESSAAQANADEPSEVAKPCSRSMQVATSNGRPTVKLSYSDPHEKWHLSVDGQVGAEWTRELLDHNPVIKVHYAQRPHQPITVVIEGVNAKPIQLSAQTLWHMTEQKSLEFERYVLPALVRLNSTWDLPQALTAAKRISGYSDRGHSAAAKHELAQSIAELDSTDRRVREAAKQKLRDSGLALQIPLEQLRGGPLSPQQRSTVEELLAELEPRSADTPTRLAYWLSGDPNWR